jgi:hypothetical protein
MVKSKVSLKDMLRRLIKLFLVSIYATFIISMIAGGISAGIIALTPPEALGWTVNNANYIGYISICSFAPFSSLMLFGMTAVGSLLFVKLIKYLKKSSKKSEIFVKLKTIANKIN